MKNLTKTLMLGCALVGCSSTSPIEKESESKSHFDDAVFKGHDFYISPQEIEGERYRIYHRASTGFSGTGGIRRSATQRANQFCRAKGPHKKMVTVSEHTAAPPYILGNFPRIEIIFVCADETTDQVPMKAATDKYDRIVKIKDLYDSGALTKEEFESEKKKILSE
jgi:Short C-terminal domain